MSTLYIQREKNCTIYYYGSVMVVVYDYWPNDANEIYTHSLVDGKHKEENNRIMWEKW